MTGRRTSPYVTTSRRSQKSSSSRSHNNNKDNYPFIIDQNGWDNPPSIASPTSDGRDHGWTKKNCSWKTMQRILSLYPSQQQDHRGDTKKVQQHQQHPQQQPKSSIDPADSTIDDVDNNNNNNNNRQLTSPGNVCCPPIIIGNRYILVAAGSVLSLYGHFRTSHGPATTTTTTTSSDDDDHHWTWLPHRSTPPLIQYGVSSSSTAENVVDRIGTMSSSSSSGENQHHQHQPLDDVVQMSFHEEYSILYVLTAGSSIHQLKLILPPIEKTSRPEQSADGDRLSGSLLLSPPPPPPPPSPTVVAINWLQTFTTKEFGVTCFDTLLDGAGPGIDIISIGYKSGNIETWKVQRKQEIEQQQQQPLSQQDRRRIRRKDKSTMLLWKGYLSQSIYSISFLEREKRTSKSPTQHEDDIETTTSKEAKHMLDNIAGDEVVHTERWNDFVMIVTVQMDATTVPPLDEEQQLTSSMVVVLDLHRIAQVISTMELLAKSDIPLNNYIVNPTPGMEFVDVTTIPLSSDSTRLPKRFPILQSNRGSAVSMSIHSHHNGNKDSNNDENSIRGVCLALPDGTVAFLSNNPSMVDAIGIVDENHQILMSYPTVGFGPVFISDKDGKQALYMASCLRGGTCYLLPIVSRDNGNISGNVVKEDDNNNHSVISTFQFPHDIASDLPYAYVQGFTAGNLLLDSDGPLQPVLVYAWPGGVVDVYVCDLIPTTGRTKEGTLGNFVSRYERQALEDMIDNESVLLLSQILNDLRTESTNPLLDEDKWRTILEDPTSLSALNSGQLDIDLLCTDEFRHIRSLLLALADNAE